MTHMSPEDKRLLEANVRKVVGVSALRRIRFLVDEWQEDDKKKTALARRILFAVGACAVLLIMLCLISPDIVMRAFRSVTVLVR